MVLAVVLRVAVLSVVLVVVLVVVVLLIVLIVVLRVLLGIVPCLPSEVSSSIRLTLRDDSIRMCGDSWISPNYCNNRVHLRLRNHRSLV